MDNLTKFRQNRKAQSNRRFYGMQPEKENGYRDFHGQGRQQQQRQYRYEPERTNQINRSDHQHNKFV